MPAIYSTYTMNDILQLLITDSMHSLFILFFLQVSLNFHSMFELKKLRKTYSNKNIMYEMTFNKSSTPTAAANFIVVMDWPLRKRASSFFLEVKCGLSLGPNHDPASLSDEECFEKRKFSGFPHLNSLEQRKFKTFIRIITYQFDNGLG